MGPLGIKRLTTADEELARSVFAMMSSVFEEEPEPVRAGYLASLLARQDVWALAAIADGAPVGGLTAFVLPLTRAERSEVFIYDIAVHQAYQRRGIGRRLVETLLSMATAYGYRTSWVAADNEDEHALDFYRSLGGVASPVTVFTFSQ